jgi:hypothetical protein
MQVCTEVNLLQVLMLRRCSASRYSKQSGSKEDQRLWPLNLFKVPHWKGRVWIEEEKLQASLDQIPR